MLRYWDRTEKTDLMRFIRLPSMKGDYLTYVTTITDDIVLMMAYEPSVSISQVRPQTRAIAQRMASAPPPGYRASESSGKQEPPPEPGPSPSFSMGGSDILPPPTRNPAADSYPPDRSALTDRATEPVEFFTAPSPLRLDETTSDSADSNLADENLSEYDKFDLASLLGAVPSPDPPGENPSSHFGSPVPNLGWVREASLWDAPPHNEEGLPAPLPTALARSEPLTIPAEPPARDEILKVPEPSTSLRLPDPEPSIDPLGDTQPHVLTTVSRLNQLEPASPALSLLNYTCVLLPRMPQHYLTGDLADRLAQWVQQFCLAFGWRLEGISIRPDYLQWTVQVTPSVSPGNLVRIIRQRTSSSIFSAYQHLKDQNPSGDFWAVGYLIVSGSQPPSAQLLRDYIQQTRKRQGILKP